MTWVSDWKLDNIYTKVIEISDHEQSAIEQLPEQQQYQGLQTRATNLA